MKPPANHRDDRQSEFPPWPDFDDADVATVTEVLRSGKVNRWTGKENEAFEEEFAAFVGCEHAVAVANGTLALELALVALGVGPGDEVIVSCRTFIASASAVVMRGATPIIADVDRISQNITADTVEPLITERTRAIIAVHLLGWPCDMDPLLALARAHDLKVIEDCAQAHGATYKGRAVGSLGDVAAFSFCQDKIMTTGGEGGMLTTNDPDLWRKAWAFKDHGKDHRAVFGQIHPPGFRWLHNSFGTNWRMTEMQAALGRLALRKLPGWITTRRRYAMALERAFLQIPALRVTPAPDEIGHAYYKYYTFVRPQELTYSSDRDTIMNAVNAGGIPCSSGICSEIYREEAFIRSGLGPKQRLPIARTLGETGLMFLVHPALSDKHIEQTCEYVRIVMDEHSLAAGRSSDKKMSREQALAARTA